MPYKNIEKERERARRYYNKHKEERKEYQKKHRRENKDKIKESSRMYRLKNKEKINARQRERNKLPETKLKRNKYIQQHSLKYKKLLFIKLTDNNIKCNYCGFSDIRALQIDHIDGGGTKDKGQMGTYSFYRKLLSLPDEKLKQQFQLLCANCNWIKRYENNEISCEQVWVE